MLTFQNLGGLQHVRRNGLLDGGNTGMFFDVAQQNLLEAGGVVEEIRFAFGGRGHFFEEGAVDVLPEAHCRDGHVIVDGFLGEGHAVALFADAVGEQHDVLVDSRLRQDARVGLGESGRNLGTAIGGDSGNEALDGGAIFRFADGHSPLERVIENEDAHRIDGAEIVHYAAGG